MKSFYVEYGWIERLSELEHCFKLTVLEVNIVFLNWCRRRRCGMAAPRIYVWHSSQPAAMK